MDQGHLAEVRHRRNRLEGHLHQGHLAEVRRRRNRPEGHLHHHPHHNLAEGRPHRNRPELHLHLLLHLRRNHLRQSRLDRHPLLRRIRLHRKHREPHPRATQ